ncbi:unnamed protein product [Caenorhabditis brenneri]
MHGSQMNLKEGEALLSRCDSRSKSCLFLSKRQLWNLKKTSKNLSVQIGDTVYNCRYLMEVEGQESDRNDIYLGYIGYKKASIFFNYILDLVRVGITEICIDLKRIADFKQFLSEPCFKNIKSIMLVGETITGKKVIELFDCFDKPVLETRVRTQIKSLSPTSKLLQSENLLLEKSKVISIEHLLNFTGKYISLYYSPLSEEDIVAFVKHWLDGNYPNLVGAIITTEEDFQYEPEKVLNEFNTKQWNPAERAQNFIYKSSLHRNEKNEFPIMDCSNGHDMVRNDGLMATMQFEDEDCIFSFYVWHNRFP